MPAAKTPSARKSPTRTPARKAAAPVPARAVIPPPEVIRVPTKRVACDGGGGALGHPLVYMEMGEDDFVECAYCDRRFEVGPHPKRESEYLDPAARNSLGGH